MVPFTWNWSWSNSFQYSRTREKRCQSCNSASLKSCLEKVECVKEDEFQFTSPEFAESIPPFACEFAVQPRHKHLLAAADEDGQVSIYDTNRDGQGALIKGWSAHNNAIFDIAWSPNEPRLVTASGDQSAALWDVKTTTRIATFKQHKCSLKSVSFWPLDGHVFATGARDGSIMIWDDRCKRRGKDGNQLPVYVVNEAHFDKSKVKTQTRRRRKLDSNLPTIDSSHSVSVVLFQNEDTLLSAGAADGIVKFWDMRQLKKSRTSTPDPCHQIPYGGSSNRKRGFSSLALSSDRTQLFASCTDSVIYEYDLCGALGTSPAARYKGHMNSTFFVRAAISPDDLFLLSGSSDNNAYIWKIGEPESPPLILEGHEAEVTSVAWCPQDFTKIVTCSDDDTMRFWKLPPHRKKDEGQSTVIGRARWCEKQTAYDSQENSLPPACTQSTHSSSDSQRSTATEEIGASPLSQPSPMPASSKKRKFSLREWVTNSPSTSGPPSPEVPSKRKTLSAPSITLTGDGEANAEGGNKRKAGEESLTVERSQGSAKKLKVTGKDDAEQSTTATKHFDNECDTKECTRDTDSVLQSRKPSKTVVDNMGKSKEAPEANSASKHMDNMPESKSRTQDIAGKKRLHPFFSSRHDKENVEGNKKRLSEDHTDIDTKSSDKENVDSDTNFDKGNVKRDHTKSSEESTSADNANSCRRSPLRDDIPMNSATCSSNQSLSARKNIAATFVNSSKSSKDCEQKMDKDEENNETKQKNLKTCFKDKKVGGLQTIKRKNSATIDGYFQPLVKRKKSET